MYFADNLGWHLVVVGLLGESMYDFFHPAELPGFVVTGCTICVIRSLVYISSKLNIPPL